MTHERILRAAIRAMLKGTKEPNCFTSWVKEHGYVNDGTFRTYGTRADYLHELERSATSELENMEYAVDYAEPGYTKPKHGILFADWNVFPRGIDTLLERAGYAVEWSDEWSICECGKAFRTEADSFCWKPAYVEEDGQWVCIECASEEEEEEEEEEEK